MPSINVKDAASSDKSLTKSIQGVTQDEARILEGLMNAIRETGVINMGNTAKLVESSQAIQAYAAQSLGHLRNIDMTTASQLTLFNKLLSPSGTSNLNGLRVVIQ